MKKIICCILVFTITLCSFRVPVFAKDWLYASDDAIEAYNLAQQFKDEVVEGFDWMNGIVGNVGSALGYAIGGSFGVVKNAVLSPIDGFLEGWNADWKEVAEKGLKDGEIRADDDYIYIHQNVINNINQKVQSRVHALDGYYLYDSAGSLNITNLDYYYKKYHNGATILNYTGRNYKNLVSVIASHSFVFVLSDGSFLGMNENYASESYYLFHQSGGYLYMFDSLKDEVKSNNFLDGSTNLYNFNMFSTLVSDGIFNKIDCVLGTPVKIFYTVQDIRNYINQGQQHYSSSLPKGLYRIPINVVKNINTTNLPNITYNNNVTNMDAPDIENSLNLTLKGYLDKLFSGESNTSPTPTPGTSGGGSGGDHGGTGGTLDPTPTPGSSDGDGFNSDAVNYLEKIYNWLTLFGESHGTFIKKVSEYLDENKGKLDEIIVAINALGSGKTETESNGCKYDFSALSDFMDKLWNASDEKFDTMIDLLEENNEYQQKLVTSLNEIKAILVTQTVLELFENRSSETANKAKDKFPTSLPWDIAMVVNAMAAEPQEIKINLPIEIKSLGIHEEIVVDLTSEEWEKLAKTCRYLLSILFILLMIQLSRKMFFSGGDD